MTFIVNEDGEILGEQRQTVFIRTPFNYDMNAASDETALVCPEETRTQQNAAEDTDINVLVKRFGVTGEMPTLDRIPVQADFVPVMDYQSAMNQLIEAQTTFMKLPADIRKTFDNDPGKFLDFTSDEKNLDKMREMGLANPKPKEPEPTLVRVVPEPTPAPK